MATIPVQKADDQVHARTFWWEALVTGSLDGAKVELPDHADCSVQVFGTWNTATLTFQGSNDGINWLPLTDPQGNDVAGTDDFLEQIVENVRYMRPLVTSVGASTDLDVYLHTRSQR